MKLYRVQVIRQSRRFVSARFSTPFRSLNCHSFVTVLGTTSLFVKLRYARHPLPGERRPREKSAANEFNFGDRLCGDRLLHHDTLLVSLDFVTFYAPLLDIFLIDNLERGRRRSGTIGEYTEAAASFPFFFFLIRTNPGDSLAWHGANICLRSCRRWNSNAFVGSWREVLLSSRDPMRFFLRHGQIMAES